ncbi:hypothetical protein SDC9_98288 [bioreactor metagenome]|uniref:Uncharacterized protein n=1 Tax=bioreactor metagenome TaxID=1076179 RepID=A0A645AED1_9ZZZZ
MVRRQVGVHPDDAGPRRAAGIAERRVAAGQDDLEEGPVVGLPLRGGLAVDGDRAVRAGDLAVAAVDALGGVDVELAGALVDGVDRTFLHAGAVHVVDAAVADHVRHCSVSFGRVAREQVESGVEQHGGVVDRRGRLAEADRDQPDLPGVVGDVARGVDPRDRGLHPRVDGDPSIDQAEAPVVHRAEVGGEAERRDDGLGGQRDRPVLPGDAHLGAADPAVAADLGHLGVDEHPDVAVADPVDRPLVGPEPVAAVHHRHRPGDRLQVQGPVEGAVAAADDHHVLVIVDGEIGDEVAHPAAQPVEAGGERAGGEGPDPAGQHDRPGVDGATGAGGQHHLAGARGGGQPLHLLVEPELRAEGLGLQHQRVDQVAAADRGIPGDVEDRLLRVHPDHLTADLRQGVDDRGPQATEAGTVGRVQPGGAGADDQQVDMGGGGPVMTPGCGGHVRSLSCRGPEPVPEEIGLVTGDLLDDRGVREPPDVLATDGGVRLRGGPRAQRDRITGGEGEQLRLHRALHRDEPPHGALDGGADGEVAVVGEDHRLVRAERRGDPLTLLLEQGDAVVLVVPALVAVEGTGVLGEW